MILTGTLINVGAVILGSLVGLAFNKRLPERFVGILFQGIGLFTLVLGIVMALKAQEWIIVILSLITGGMLGELLKLETFFENLATRIGKRFHSAGAKFNEGLLTAFLLFCMGSMTILGAIEEGMGGAPNLYLIKSLMDGISSIALASGLGLGVMFSVVPLILYQGGLTIFASFFGSFMPELMIISLTATGGVLLVGLGLNILKISQIRMLNLLPALLMAVLISWIFLVVNA
jgi:uncharacterized membrane protein YqgA involved in biofilm formation